MKKVPLNLPQYTLIILLLHNTNKMATVWWDYPHGTTRPVKDNFQRVLLSQRDAGEMAALTLLFTIAVRARGQSVPSDTDGGNKTARRSSLGQEKKKKKKKQAQRNAIICMRCRLALLPARC